jgi:hypothetical protein
MVIMLMIGEQQRNEMNRNRKVEPQENFDTNLTRNHAY